MAGLGWNGIDCGWTRTTMAGFWIDHDWTRTTMTRQRDRIKAHVRMYMYMYNIIQGVSKLFRPVLTYT